MNNSNQKEYLLRQLRLLKSRKPPENSPPSVEDDFHLKSHELYFEIISRYPSFAVDNKLELEMWNDLYKAPIDLLQNALHHRTNVSTASGQPRSVMELKLRSVLLLDRASGVYLTLIHRLLQPLNDSSWPKSVLGLISSPASPNGLFQLNRLGRTSGRFDLDLVTFSALQKFIKLDYIGPKWFQRQADGDVNEFSIITTTAAPRILSRGDRLPQESDTQSNQSAELQSADSETQCSSASSSAVNADSTAAVASVEPSSPAPVVTRIDHASAVTYIVQHCLVHLGDVARYRQQSNVAAGYYLWAWTVHPDSGHPYNQLAILESAKLTPNRRLDALFYYYVRATSCIYPFPAARSNLKSMLRSHIAVLHATAIKQTDTNTHTTDCTTQPPRDPRHILLFLYAAFHLGLDPVRLIPFTKEFANIVNGGPQIRLNEQWICRLLVIHIFLLDELLSEIDSTPSGSQHAELPEQPTLNKQEFTIMLLIHITVNWIDWLSRSYLALIEQHGPMEARAYCAPLSGILLLLLWFRKVATMSSASRLTWFFKNYVPAFSEHVVRLFNDLAHQSVSTSDCISALASDPKIPEELSHTDKSDCSSIDWPKLIHLPELATLQGFQPLNVPTQRQLGLTSPLRPRCPLRISPRLLLLQDASTNVVACDLKAEEIEFSTAASSSDQHQLRLMFVVMSMRVVAQTFPALIQSTNAPVTDGKPGSGTFVVQFTVVCTPKPDLKDLAPKSVPERKISNNLRRPSNHAPTSETVSVENRELTELEPSIAQTKLNATLSVESVDLSKENGTATSTKLEDVSQNEDGKSPTVLDLAAPNSDQSSQNNTPAESTTMLPTPLGETEPKLVSSQGNTSTVSTTASGGLIVNAELAKFIQEQASQVAARQQRVGFSTIASADPASGGFHSGKLASSNGLHKSSSAGTFRTSGSKGVSTRLCLSAAFRRDLPPRFAKRLQAELLEREAQEARQIALDSKTIGNTASNLALLSLDQPAPLARKESEAPFELNSLLSGTDAMPLSGTHLSADTSIDGRLPLRMESLHDLIDNMPIASQTIAPTTYDAPIHPSLSAPSMLPPPLSAPLRYFNTERQIPPPGAMFGAPLNVPPTMHPMFDWRMNQDSSGAIRQAQLDDYVPNSTLALSRFHNQPPPPFSEHYSRPVHPLADVGFSGAPTLNVMTTVQEEDQARLAELMSIQSFGTSMESHPFPPKACTKADQSSLNSYTTVP